MRDMTEQYDTYDDQDDYDWDYEDDRPPRPKVLWGRVISLSLFVAIAFLLGLMLSPAEDAATDAQVEDLQSDVTRLETENEGLKQDVAELEAALANTGGETDEEPGSEGETNDPGPELEPEEVTVGQGDTLLAIIQKQYGCTSVANEAGDSVNLVEFVTDAQTDPTFNANSLNAGQTIIIPGVPEGYACP